VINEESHFASNTLHVIWSDVVAYNEKVITYDQTMQSHKVLGRNFVGYN